MSEITILHLSDIHFKKKEEEENKTFRQTVQQRLIEAAATHNQEHGSPDVVAVTGDIAFSGKEHEYKEAAEFFKELKKVLPAGHMVSRGGVCCALANMSGISNPWTRKRAAGEILGALGDPRINVLSPPMVLVESGEFIRGSDESDEDDEKPERRIYLDEFMIGKYPVTNQEFKVFIEDGGYDNKEFWAPEGWHWREKENIVEPGLWHDRKREKMGIPILYQLIEFSTPGANEVNVGWFEF